MDEEKKKAIIKLYATVLAGVTGAVIFYILTVIAATLILIQLIP